jgi:hypothetical protein
VCCAEGIKLPLLLTFNQNTMSKITLFYNKFVTIFA